MLRKPAASRWCCRTQRQLSHASVTKHRSRAGRGHIHFALERRSWRLDLLRANRPGHRFQPNDSRGLLTTQCLCGRLCASTAYTEVAHLGKQRALVDRDNPQLCRSALCPLSHSAARREKQTHEEKRGRMDTASKSHLPARSCGDSMNTQQTRRHVLLLSSPAANASHQTKPTQTNPSQQRVTVTAITPPPPPPSRPQQSTIQKQRQRRRRRCGSP